MSCCGKLIGFTGNCQVILWSLCFEGMENWKYTQHYLSESVYISFFFVYDCIEFVYGDIDKILLGFVFVE